MSFFQTLPDEIKIIIFSYISFYDLITSVKNVCLKWRTLVCAPVTIKRIEIDRAYPLEKIIKRLRAIDEVHSTTERKPPFFDANVIQSCHLKSCNFNSYTELSQLIAYFPKLARLIVSDCCFVRRVTDYEIRRCFGADKILAVASTCTELTTLKSDTQCSFTRYSFEKLINSRGQHLMSLSLNGRNLKKIHVDVLSRCRKLKELNLYSLFSITFSDLTSITELRALKSLTLNYAIIVTANEFVAIFQKWLLLDLRSLNLSSCYELNDAAIIAIAKSHRYLKRLNLTGCGKITAAGVSAVRRICSDLKDVSHEKHFTKIVRNYVCDRQNVKP